MIWNEEKENLERLINVEKLSYEEIGRRYNCTGGNIKKVAKKLGITLEARRVINPKETFNKKERVEVEMIDKTTDAPIVKSISFKNYKQIGEIGERVTIGELSKWGFDILLPLSDNLPYDLVAAYNDKFYRCQVKSGVLRDDGSVRFSLTSNNWYSKTIHKYSDKEVDVFICCDLNNIFLFNFNELEGRREIYIRYSKTSNGQNKGINFASDYIISEKRIKEVFQ